MKIGITGSKGFIGSHVMESLKKNKEHAIIGIDEDIRNIDKLRPYFEDLDFLVHAAGQTKDTDKIEDYYANNVIGTRNIVDLCTRYDIKLIHLSSIETRGHYGNSKKRAEDAVRFRCKIDGTKAIILRLCPIYNDNKVRKRTNYHINHLVNDINIIIKKHNFNKYKLIDYEKHFLLPKPGKKILREISTNG